MKKVIVLMLIMMNLVSINASEDTYKYKIVASSNNSEDINEMYETKDQLIQDYKSWIKGVDDIDQALADHQENYHAKYYNGEYVIILGEGKGKDITGKLRASYCASSKDIEKKSFIASLFS